MFQPFMPDVWIIFSHSCRMFQPFMPDVSAIHAGYLNHFQPFMPDVSFIHAGYLNHFQLFMPDVSVIHAGYLNYFQPFMPDVWIIFSHSSRMFDIGNVRIEIGPGMFQFFSHIGFNSIWFNSYPTLNSIQSDSILIWSYLILDTLFHMHRDFF